MLNFIKSLFYPKEVNDDKNNTILSAAPMAPGQMSFILNDMTTPELVRQQPIPEIPRPSPSFSVANWAGGGVAPFTPEGQAAQAYAVLCTAIGFFQKIRPPVKKWAATNNLRVVPRAGRDLNAFYDRRGLKFFFEMDPVTKKMVYTVDSVDIVAHELGHALLDCLRPDFWSMQALEIWGFHEAWADSIAMLTMMQADEVLEHALRTTKGDLGKPNVISNLAEEMGTTIYNVVKGRGGRKPGALRSAINDFTYTPPEKLPYQTPDNVLGGECHSFGKLFLGAFYDCFAGIYEMEAKNHSQMDAIKIARDESGKALTNAVTMAPATPRMYDAVARAMIAYDRRTNGGKYAGIYETVFKGRKILQRRVKAMTDKKLSDLGSLEDLMKDYHSIVASDSGVVLTKRDVKVMKLSDHFGIRAQSDNPLYDVEIEVPNQTMMEFDGDGNLVEEIVASEKVVIASARQCIKALHADSMVKDGKAVEDNFEKMFSIVKGKLVRNFIA